MRASQCSRSKIASILGRIADVRGRYAGRFNDGCPATRGFFLKALLPVRRLSPTITLISCLAFAAVATLGVFAYRNIAAVRRGEALIAHTYAVREVAREFLSAVKDMESGERGYLITRDPSYLDPHHAALATVDEPLARLRRLTRDDPAQQARLDRLSRLLLKKQAEVSETIALRGRGEETASFANARALIITAYGQATMDEMRGIVAEMLDREQALLVEREAAAQWRATTSQRLIVAANLIALALVVFSGVAVQVDRRKRDEAETQLRASRVELGAIVNSAGDGIVTFDEDLEIRFINPAAAEFFCCGVSTALGQSLLTHFPSTLREFVAEDIRNFLHSDATRCTLAAKVALRDDGSEFPFTGTIAKATVPGEGRFLTLMFRDLSETHAKEAKIREHVTILNEIHEAIIVCDMDDNIVSWNQGARSLHGHGADAVLGKNVVGLLFDHQRDIWEAGTAKLLRTGAYATELPQLDGAGRNVIVEHRRSLILGTDGRPSAQVIMHFDITARRQEEERQRQSQRLESIGTLTGGIAHDLNNVLTPILMGAKLLKRSGNDHEQLLDAIVASAERGGQMIKKLLAFVGGRQSHEDRMDVRKILLETEQLLQHTLPSNIDLRVACADNLHCVDGNETELSQVLMNLAINARDAMPDGGRLELVAENCPPAAPTTVPRDSWQAGPHIQIRVRDSGCGITPENLQHIFDPFFTTKPLGKGTGLGLATSLGIIRSHGGDVTVDSRPGEGTQFSIYLPAASAATATRMPAPTSESIAGNGELILLVDDEHSIVLAAKVALEASGYRVLAAGGGAEAVRLFRQQADSVDAVLLDMMMPDMDGFATIDALRATDPQVRIIASSGVMPRETGRKQLQGLDGFLLKPYTDDQLLSIVATVLHAGISSP